MINKRDFLLGSMTTFLLTTRSTMSADRAREVTNQLCEELKMTPISDEEWDQITEFFKYVEGIVKKLGWESNL